MSKLNGITYNWKIDDFNFTLFISEEKNRFKDEGIIQIIHFNINDYRIREGMWGRNEFLQDIESEKISYISTEFIDKECIFTEDSFKFKTDDFSEYEIISGENYKEFSKWLLTCLSPKYEGRIIKINKLRERICYTENI